MVPVRNHQPFTVVGTLATQTVIGQAQGILMERHKLTAGQAFNRLRTASTNLNRKLRDVARDLSETGDECPPRRAPRGFLSWPPCGQDE